MKLLNLILAAVILAGCTNDEATNEVIVYTSVDQHYSEPLFEQFRLDTGIKVQAVYDVEANKTTGLVNRLISERARPKADVFWNGEYSQTMLLAAQGVLANYRSPQSDRALWHDPFNLWAAFGGRVRVLIINPEAMGDQPMPDSIFDLVDERWPADKVGLALPLFGTTATHAAAIWSYLGPSVAIDYFLRLKVRGVQFLNGNSVVMDKVASGDLWFGLTDSDDACSAAARGKPITIRYPDQKKDGMGALIIPNSVAMIAGGPNAGNARKFIDYLLGKKSEELLSKIGWFHFSSGKISTSNDCPMLQQIRVLKAMPDKVYPILSISRTFLRELLLR